MPVSLLPLGDATSRHELLILFEKWKVQDLNPADLIPSIYINCMIHALVIIYHWSSTFFHPLSPSSAPLAGQADDGCRQAGEGQGQVVQPRGWNTSNITELFTVLQYVYMSSKDDWKLYWFSRKRIKCAADCWMSSIWKDTDGPRNLFSGAWPWLHEAIMEMKRQERDLRVKETFSKRRSREKTIRMVYGSKSLIPEQIRGEQKTIVRIVRMTNVRVHLFTFQLSRHVDLTLFWFILFCHWRRASSAWWMCVCGRVTLSGIGLCLAHSSSLKLYHQGFQTAVDSTCGCSPLRQEFFQGSSRFYRSSFWKDSCGGESMDVRNISFQQPHHRQRLHGFEG